MRLLARLLFDLYILFAIVFIFIPLSFISMIVGYINKVAERKRDSYFIDTKYANSHYVDCNGMRCHSVLAYLTVVVFTPCLWLSRYIEKNLFRPATRQFNATPNQAAAIVISQILGNLRGIKEVSCDLNAEYIFALQPTLMDTGAETAGDELFLKKRREDKVMGFPYISFFQAYYSKLRQAIKGDNKLKDNFLDTSMIFTGTKEQRLVDTCHLGDVAQEELASFIAKKITQGHK